jgi:crotonobetainyl-CoA:carnitine CoA-transferase CaiB-like acyl-CoA transferase
MGYLSQYRVIDLADRALLAGHMFAQLGAKVIQVEPPEGSPARRVAPFDTGVAGAPSLHWAAYHYSCN